jgi:hypothetical protein
MNKTWELMKLAFEYFSLGFQRIIFMVCGAQIAFLICYFIFCDMLYGTAIPAPPVGYTYGSETLSGAMLISALAAVMGVDETSIRVLLARVPENYFYGLWSPDSILNLLFYLL